MVFWPSRKKQGNFWTTLVLAIWSVKYWYVFALALKKINQTGVWMPSKSFVGISINLKFWLSNCYCHCERTGSSHWVLWGEGSWRCCLEWTPFDLAQIQWQHHGNQTQRRQTGQLHLQWWASWWNRKDRLSKPSTHPKIMSQVGICCEQREERVQLLVRLSKVHKKENGDLPKHLKKKKMVWNTNKSVIPLPPFILNRLDHCMHHIYI